MALSSSVDPDVTEPSQCTENMARVCRFLVSEYPKAILMKAGGGRGLPLQYLARQCSRPLVQDLMMLMLKLYPQAVGIRSWSVSSQACYYCTSLGTASEY